MNATHVVGSTRNRRFLVGYYRWPYPPTEHEGDWPVVVGLAQRLGELTVLVPGDRGRVFRREQAEVRYLASGRHGMLGRLRFVMAAATRMAWAGRGQRIIACGSDPVGAAACYLATRLVPGRLLVQVQDDFWGDYYARSETIRRRLASRQMAFLVRQGDLVRVLSERYAHEVVRLGVPAERVRLVRSRVDVRCFVPAQRTPGPPDVVRFMFVGSLVERKGLRVLLPAFATVGKDLAATELVIVGDGPLKEWGEAWAATAGLSGRIHWLGRRRHGDVKGLLDTAHCLVLPSFAEGTPRVLMEAMALGVPCVASRVGGTPSVLPAGSGDAVLVPPGDAVALAGAMASVGLRWREGRVDGGALRRWVVGRFSLEGHLDGMAALFGGPGPEPISGERCAS